ncbi:hypothetical protein MRB53_039422 [Persea americana]|nr:hypothetical protein MRB53_039422 [Persea americana]
MRFVLCHSLAQEKDADQVCRPAEKATEQPSSAEVEHPPGNAKAQAENECTPSLLAFQIPSARSCVCGCCVVWETRKKAPRRESHMCKIFPLPAPSCFILGSRAAWHFAQTACHGPYGDLEGRSRSGEEDDPDIRPARNMLLECHAPRPNHGPAIAGPRWIMSSPKRLHLLSFADLHNVSILMTGQRSGQSYIAASLTPERTNAELSPESYKIHDLPRPRRTCRHPARPPALTHSILSTLLTSQFSSPNPRRTIARKAGSLDLHTDTGSSGITQSRPLRSLHCRGALRRRSAEAVRQVRLPLAGNGRHERAKATRVVGLKLIDLSCARSSSTVSLLVSFDGVPVCDLCAKMGSSSLRTGELKGLSISSSVRTERGAKCGAC